MKISFIMPAYNCEDTVIESIDSVLSNESDIELIIVNDGSRDGTLDVLRSVKDERVTVIDQKNAGPAAARQRGMKEAKGDYIGFIDCDDVLLPGAVDCLCEAASGDMVVFGFRQTFTYAGREMIYLPNGSSLDELLEANMMNALWNKLYRRAFIEENSVTFDDFRYGEDRLFNAKCMAFLPQVTTVEKCLYEYRIDSQTSLVSGFVENKHKACAEYYKRLLSLGVNKATASQIYIKSALSCFTVLFADNCRLDKKEKTAYVKAVLDLNETRRALEEKLGGYYGVIEKIFRLGAKPTLMFSQTVAITQKKFLPLFLKFRK